MQNMFRSLLDAILYVAAFVLMCLPFLGLLFGVSIALSLLGWACGSAFEETYFLVAWKVYVGFAIVTFPFLITVDFLHQSAWRGGSHTLVRFVRDRSLEAISVDLLGALLWPWTWFVLNLNLGSWGSCFAEAVCCSIAYWTVGWNRQR